MVHYAFTLNVTDEDVVQGSTENEEREKCKTGGEQAGK